MSLYIVGQRLPTETNNLKIHILNFFFKIQNLENLDHFLNLNPFYNYSSKLKTRLFRFKIHENLAQNKSEVQANVFFSSIF